RSCLAADHESRIVETYMATDIPKTGAGTWEEPSWAEDGTFSASGYKNSGIPQGALVGPNDFNYPRRLNNRWVRALRDRMVPSDAGLYGSFMFPGSGSWNVGDGTLDGVL